MTTQHPTSKQIGHSLARLIATIRTIEPPTAKHEPASDLFGFVRPRAKRRALMHFTDAGPGYPNWARFECAKCGYKMETHTATDSDLRRGAPCPRCKERLA